MARSDASYSFTPRPLTSVRDLPVEAMAPAPAPQQVEGQRGSS